MVRLDIVRRLRPAPRLVETRDRRRRGRSLTAAATLAASLTFPRTLRARRFARVLDLLKSQSVPEEWVRMVAEVVDVGGEERSRLFGESLPIGLRVLRSD